MAGSSKDPRWNQLATEFYARFMQVILESRIPAFMPASSHCEDGSTSTSGRRAQGPAFNITLGKFGAIIDRMEPWCKGVQDPMVIDILFSKRGNNRAMEGLGQKMVQGAGEYLAQAPTGIAFAASGFEQPVLLERWTVEFLQHHSRRETDVQFQKGMIGQHLRGNYKSRVGSLGDNRRGEFSGKSETAAAYNAVEKNMAILLRSVYCTARLLPAQNLFRLLSTSHKSKFKLSYKVTASPSPLRGCNSKDMTDVCFTAIEIHGGHIRVSVTHRRKNPSPEHEIYTLCPQIITDYVGRAASLPSNQLPTERTGQLHSLPSSTQRLSSFKFDNLQLHGLPNKEVVMRELDHTHTVSMGCGDFSLVDDEGFECPFAINDEQYDNRMESAKLRSVTSDSGRYGRTQVPGGPLEAFLAFQRPAAPLSGAYQPKKDVANSLKELKMYIDFKDCLLK